MSETYRPGPPDLWPDSWLVPDWPALPGVHAICTSREGGVSQAPWGSMNLGDHVSDNPAHVRRNRELFNAALQARDGVAARAAVEGHLDYVRRLLANERQAERYEAVARQRLESETQR